ncbi:MAG: DUF2268 domain-containing protein [Spirochaetes bacterium]|nr:DUF2268 domain-containing protein [Spirochaetota bacterium]
MNFKKRLTLSPFLLILCGCAFLFYHTDELAVYESDHFVIYYTNDSKISSHIKSTSQSLEQDLDWLCDLLQINNNLTIDIYIYLTEEDVPYEQTLQSTFSSGVSDGLKIIVCYESLKYSISLLKEVIIHEYMHVIQYTKFVLLNIGIGEGFATFYQYIYHDKKDDGNYSYSGIFQFFINQVQLNQLSAQYHPEYLFSLDYLGFMNVNLSTLDSDRHNHYFLSASFVCYLVDQYGVGLLKEWFNQTNKNNFIQHFNQAYPQSFYEVQSLWIEKVNSLL